MFVSQKREKGERGREERLKKGREKEFKKII